nr:hypothetical protein [Micromonospora sp. DSM 115978]
MLLLLAALVTVATIQDDYYVGERQGRVTIFRGVETEILGVPLHVVDESYPLRVADLPESTQRQLRDGAPMADLAEAR